jgi:hypothetical protein
VKVIAFSVRIFSAGSKLGLDRKFNRKLIEKLQNCFLVFSVLAQFKPEIQPRIQPRISGSTENSTGNSTGNFWSNREFNRKSSFAPNG